MKTLAQVIVLALLGGTALLPAAAHAKCAYYTSWTWPEAGATLPTNGRIVLDGYGALQPVIAELGARHPELRSASERVPLRVVTIHKGEMSVTQAVLVPAHELAPRTRYELHVDARKDDKPINRFDRGREVAYAWTTGPGPDHAVPEWAGAPRSTGGKYGMLGCGPVIEAFLAAQATDPSGVIFLARVEPAAGGAAVEYLVTPRDGQLPLGHGMCSGPFKLGGGVEYRVTLTAVDAAGNASVAPGEPVKIVGPAPKDEAD